MIRMQTAPRNKLSMCHPYSITTNQAAIAGLFRVVQPLCRQPRADAGPVSRLSGSGDPQLARRTQNDHDALGHAAAAEAAMTAGHKYPDHDFTAPTVFPRWRKAHC